MIPDLKNSQIGDLMASQDCNHRFKDERKEGQKGRRGGPSGVVHLGEVDVLQQR